MIELDRRMEIRLNALIAVKTAIMPSFCGAQGRCDVRCPLYKSDDVTCYWMKAMYAIDDLETIMCGHGLEIRHDTKPERSTREQSRFADII